MVAMIKVFTCFINISVIILTILAILIDFKHTNYYKKVSENVHNIKNKSIKLYVNIIKIMKILIFPYKKLWNKDWYQKISIIFAVFVIILSEILTISNENIKSVVKNLLLITVINIFLFIMGSIFLSIAYTLIYYFAKKIMIIKEYIGDLIITVNILIIIPNIVIIYLKMSNLIKLNDIIFTNIFSLIIAYYLYFKILIGVLKNPEECIGKNKIGVFSWLVILLGIYIILSFLLVVNFNWLKNDENGIFGIGDSNQLFKIFLCVIILIFSIGGFDSISNYSIYEYLIIIFLMPLSMFFWTIFVSKLISYSNDS